MRAMRLAIVAGTVAAMALAGTASANAASTSCSAGGLIKLSPGLGTEAQVQNVTVKGTLSGCESSESHATEGKFEAHFKTAEAIGCEALTTGGVGAAAEENKIIIKLNKKKHMGNSQGTFSVDIAEGPNQLLSGLIESGPFAEDTIGGSINETYTGSHHCGERKNGKQVKKGTFVGTLSLS